MIVSNITKQPYVEVTEFSRAQLGDKKTSKFETIFPKCQQSNVAFFRNGITSFDKTFVRNLDNVYIPNDVKTALLTHKLGNNYE